MQDIFSENKTNRSEMLFTEAEGDQVNCISYEREKSECNLTQIGKNEQPWIKEAK